MISNVATQKRVAKEKEKVLKQLYSIFPTKSSLNLSLCGVEENIALWNLQIDSNGMYFYTDLQGKVLFGGNLFALASNFSQGCAWVKDFDGKWYIINSVKKEIVEMPIEDMPWQNIRDIRHGNLAILNIENQWGSYFYNSEDNTFQQDVPFIWDALEFSRKENIAYVGAYSSRTFVNSLDEWGPENVEMQLKIAKLSKEKIYNANAYQYFLQQYFLNQNIGVDIIGYEETVPLHRKIELQKEFISCAHNIADDYFDEQRESLLNTNRNEIIETGNLDDYTRVRGRVLK